MSSLETLLARLRVHSVALVGVIVACVAAFRTRHLVVNSGDTLTRAGILFDDAFFYATLARNFVKLGFLTLDGETPTNGVQPLWQAVLIALHWLFPSWDLIAMNVTLTWLLYAAACGLASALLWRVFRPSGILPVAMLVGFGLLGTRFFGTVLRGLETPLFLFVLSLWLWASELLRTVRDAGKVREWHYAAFGVVCALLFLARTDWFVASIVSFVWVCGVNKPFSQGRWQLPALRSVAAFGLALGAIVLPYLVHNWVSHGHPMPISGRVKLYYMTKYLPTLAEYLASEEWAGPFSLVQQVFKIPHKAKAISWVTGGLWLGAMVVGVMLYRKAPRARLWLAAVCLHWAFMQLAYRELRPYTDYYFAAEALTVCVLVGVALNWAIAKLPLRKSYRSYALAGVAVLVLAWVVADPKPSVRSNPRWDTRLQLAKDLKRLPSKARLGAFWPGVFAYYSKHSVFPLDGIVGSRDYFENVVKKNRELDYARKHGVEYVISHVPPGIVESSRRPRPKDWSQYGVERMWEGCNHLRTTKYRRVRRGEGWFVYKLEKKPVPKPNKCRGRR